MTFTIFFAILAIFVSLLIFFENRDPAKTISWLLVMIFLPGIGFELYLLFGENLRSSKVKKTKVAVAKFLNSQIGFLDISKITLNAINKFNNVKPTSIEEIFEIDKEVRNYCGA